MELRICLIIPDVSLKFSPAFQNIETAFKRCFLKEVVQQNYVMKYSSSAAVFKGWKELHANLLKSAPHCRYFTSSSEQEY